MNSPACRHSGGKWNSPHSGEGNYMDAAAGTVSGSLVRKLKLETAVDIGDN